MKVLRFVLPGENKVRLGQYIDGMVYEYADRFELIGVLEMRELPDENCPVYRYEDVKPILPFMPKTIYGIGLNYPSHPLQDSLGQVQKPAVPLIFLKGCNAAAGPFDDVRCPAVTQCMDYEGELAVVIGSGGRVLGYCAANDFTLRDLQKTEKQWTRAKGFDNSCPFGPWITSADEIPNPYGLSLRTWVNGCLRQDSLTQDLLFKIDELLGIIKQTNTLQSADLILTGSPAGTGISQQPPLYLKPGDTVRIEISNLGRIENRICG